LISTFDTNVLVYATSAADAAKAARARALITRGMRSAGSILLLQTLGEFANVAIRKAGLAPDLVTRTIDAWRAVLPVHPAAEEDLPAALALVRDHRIQLWDALLLATARRVGVRALLTEDMQDGRVIEGIHLLNPFLPGNDGAVDRILPL